MTENELIPRTHAEAMASNEAKFWKDAEQIELNALKEKHTFGKINGETSAIKMDIFKKVR